MRATIGVDIGATKIAFGVLKGEQLLEKSTIPTPIEGWRSVLDSIVSKIRLLEKSNPETREVEIGVGVPGTHDRARTEVLFAPNIHGFENVPIVSYLTEHLGRPVELENDANAAALAEANLGAAKHASSSMFITISTGIGGSIIVGWAALARLPRHCGRDWSHHNGSRRSHPAQRHCRSARSGRQRHSHRARRHLRFPQADLGCGSLPPGAGK